MAEADRRTVAYARVSSHDQKDDLERQRQVLELYCARQGWTFEVIADLGSGMDYQKKGLKRLLDAIVDSQIGRLAITHKDRLLRFGAELVFAICEAKGVEVVLSLYRQCGQAKGELEANCSAEHALPEGEKAQSSRLENPAP